MRASLQDVVACIASEVFAQLDELSDDTVRTVNDTDDPESFMAEADDLRETLRAAVMQRLDDWRAEHDPDWHPDAAMIGR